MNDALAHERLNGVLELIDRWGDLYERRWGHKPPHYQEQPGLDSEVKEGIDEDRARTRFAQDVIAAMGENEIAAKVVEHEEGQFGGHPFTQAASRSSKASRSLITGGTGRDRRPRRPSALGIRAAPSHLGRGSRTVGRWPFSPGGSDRCQRTRRSTAGRSRPWSVGRKPRPPLFNQRPDARIATPSTSRYRPGPQVKDVEISSRGRGRNGPRGFYGRPQPRVSSRMARADWQ
jgi:hypothetical protein